MTLLPPAGDRRRGTLHYALARTHSPKKDSCLEQKYFTWSDQLHLAHSQKTSRTLPQLTRQRHFARAQLLQRIHAEMGFSDALGKWIEFYCTNEIHDQFDNPLLIATPEAFRSPKITAWLDDTIQASKKPKAQERHIQWYETLEPYLERDELANQRNRDSDIKLLAQYEASFSEIDFPLFISWLVTEKHEGRVAYPIRDIRHLFSKAFTWLREAFLQEQDYLRRQARQRQAERQQAKRRAAQLKARQRRITELKIKVASKIIYHGIESEVLKIGSEGEHKGKLYINTGEDILWVSPLRVELARGR